MITNTVSFGNAEPCDVSAIPLLQVDEFRSTVVELYQHSCTASVFSVFSLPDGKAIVAVFADPTQGLLHACATPVGISWESMTPVCPPLHFFEREISELHGITLENHPFPEPLRYPATCAERADSLSDLPPPGSGNFIGVAGEGIHEVAVGPVHAGIIEPGHFRFMCSGENVHYLQIALGYQHRGIERALDGGPHSRTHLLMETLSGDTTIGHSLAYVHMLEGCAYSMVPPRAAVLRGIMLELERLANHVGDLGAIAGDVGYLPTSSFCGRLRGEFLNISGMICGSRFGRSFIRNGGVGFDITPELILDISKRLAKAYADTKNSIELLFSEPSVMARLEGIGTLSLKTAMELGLVGPAARACGLVRDVRADFPIGIYQFSHIPVSISESGDVFARAHVRWLEVQRSIAFVGELLKRMPAGPVAALVETSLPPNTFCVSLVEGWRGEIAHCALTDSNGCFAAYKVVDPSFHNWSGLSTAMRGEQISDFPLCNKSFNLSYCGFDL